MSAILRDVSFFFALHRHSATNCPALNRKVRETEMDMNAPAGADFHPQGYEPDAARC
ncbi:hypothetical protein [Paracoccus sulfuroxidans]|uniref:hypothetical protein n=1 Tax=Paracoccus sulfuroxidans TaxID=384678 RepID=UPI001315A2AB|nr:hypothetical protein [Paracoccus sulfuroxidans]